MSHKICVYAICKNELKFVNQWLESMSEADYIVVLDTGSTDGTYEALQADPRVSVVKQEVINPWRFDVARNRSMKLIPDDAAILVCTDFDEVFEPGWAAQLKSHWDPAVHTRAMYTYAWAHGELGEPQFVFKYDKIHTRDYEWRFPVHEVLGPKDKSNFVEHFLDFGDTIYLHHGQDKSKPRGTYLPLLHLAAEENPQNSHMWSLLGREYLVNKDYNKALEVFFETLRKEDIEYADEGKVLIQTLYFIALCYHDLGNYEECAWYCQEFLRVNNTYREPYFLLARAYVEMKLYTLAEATVEAGIKYSTYKQDGVETGTSWTYEADIILGAVYLNLSRGGEARAALVKALHYSPDNITLLKQYAYTLEKLMEER